MVNLLTYSTVGGAEPRGEKLVSYLEYAKSLESCLLLLFVIQLRMRQVHEKRFRCAQSPKIILFPIAAIRDTVARARRDSCTGPTKKVV
jgi:hypothetical protein